MFGQPPCSVPSRQLCGLALSPAYWVLARVLSLPGQPVECLPPPGGQDTQARALQLAKLETKFRGRGTWVWAWPRQISVLQMWPPSVPLEQEGGSWCGCWGSLQAQLCPRPLYPEGPLFGAQGKPDDTPGLQNKDWTEAQSFPQCLARITEAKGRAPPVGPLAPDPRPEEEAHHIQHHVQALSPCAPLSLPGPGHAWCRQMGLRGLGAVSPC